MRTGSLLLALLALLAAAMLVAAGCTTTPPTNQTNNTTATTPAGNGTPFVTPSVNVTTNGTPNVTAPSLTNVTWQWNAIQNATGANVTVVSAPQNYTITFTNATQYSFKADCNVGGGTYSKNGTTITIQPGVSTLIFCGNQSLDSVFLASLKNVTAYDISTPGKLVLTLNATGNKMVFSSASATPIVAAPFVNSTYRWVARSGSQSISVPSPDRYTIRFNANGTYALRADCNNGTGNFTVNATKVKINPANLTKTYCGDASLDKTYTAGLGQVTSYEIDASGRLVLIMVNPNERLTFTKVA